uniref:SelT/SelW/SelH family protein n=1 Tax=Thermorudis peleae TaxID=1382356 RepID=A0A831T839_9BACT
MELLLGRFEEYIEEIALKPSDGGRFEVTVDGELVYSKHMTGRFPEEDELVRLVGERLGT